MKNICCLIAIDDDTSNSKQSNYDDKMLKLISYLNAIDKESMQLMPRDIKKYVNVGILCVDPVYQRQGIAQKLVALAIQMAVNNGCDGIYSQVR
jgi:GNAT superfamily N-acetyltransferase